MHDLGSVSPKRVRLTAEAGHCRLDSSLITQSELRNNGACSKSGSISSSDPAVVTSEESLTSVSSCGSTADGLLQLVGSRQSCLMSVSKYKESSSKIKVLVMWAGLSVRVLWKVTIWLRP